MAQAADPIVARPFLKWAGGKSQLLSQFERYYPPELQRGEIHRYVEPFVGGGAVFLDVVQRYDVGEAYLIDVNLKLILAYRVIRRAPEQLIARLRAIHDCYYALAEGERKPYYYAMRAAYNALQREVDPDRFSDAWVARTAHLIFLNKTCYNGLYRVNAKGEFNVPFGRYVRPAILDEGNLRALSALLQRTELVAGDFYRAERFVDDDTFVYFDPPYRPLSQTASFTSYARRRFDDDDQVALGRFYAHLDRTCGARLMLSNSDPANVDPGDDFFRRLYGEFNLHRVRANRTINAHADKRGKVTELVITNYPTAASASP
jgi:DNA adenine methylase